MNKPTTHIFHRRKEKGFTLIEVMIGMAILSIGLLAIGVMQTSAVRNNRTGNTFTQANALACQQMELIKNADIRDVDGLLVPGTTQDPANPINGIYNRSWTINSWMEDTDGDGVDDTVSNTGRMVTVNVTFPFTGDGTRNVTLTSMVTGDGI